MAKATGIASQARGKVGNAVYYLAKNRSGRLEQLVKGYQPVVANPQSYAQALARVPIGPVQRVCSALLPLIQRGFEGTAYGEPSKSEFLSINLRNFRGPFMEKGAVAVPPGPMVITKGSLESVGVRSFDPASDCEYVIFDLLFTTNYDPATYGDLATKLLQLNEQLKQGEQLTFVIVTINNGSYHYYYQSIYLNPSDTRPLDGILTGAIGGDNHLLIPIDESPAVGYIVAATVIRSQPYGDSSFKRSTAILACNPKAELYNDDAAVRAAVASYRTGEDPEDWEDDPTPEYQQLAYVCLVTITEDMVISGASQSAIGTQCLGYVTKGGEMGVFYLYSTTFSHNCLLNSDGSIKTVTVQGLTTGVGYKASYQPAREWSPIYGTMNT